MYSYKSLDEKLKNLELKKSDLTSKLGISSRTIAKMAKGEKLANNVLVKIAGFLECNPEDLYIESYENHILQILKEEKANKTKNGLYHEFQIKMTYNSNHMGGCKLTEGQTRQIFETRSIRTGDLVSVDDIIETLNGFRAIDYLIDVALEPLSEDIIKHIHYILKQGTKESWIEGYPIGEYKKESNTARGNETYAPSEVPDAMKNMISDYLNKENKTIEDIILLFAHFETIHPFQDTNGRVGKLITFKECLKNNILPFIIDDSKKEYYYKGLENWEVDKRWLIYTCLDAQDSFRELLNKLHIPETIDNN